MDDATKQNYPFCLDMTSLPVTHNHVIGAVQCISLDNARGVLALLGRLLHEVDGRELLLSEDETAGLACVLRNACEALRFEQYHRVRAEEAGAAHGSD